MILLVMMCYCKQSIVIRYFYTQVTIEVIGLRLNPWVIFTPALRAWFGFKPTNGKGENHEGSKPNLVGKSYI